jgi:hypothetical protein
VAHLSRLWQKGAKSIPGAGPEAVEDGGEERWAVTVLSSSTPSLVYIFKVPNTWKKARNLYLVPGPRRKMEAKKVGVAVTALPPARSLSGPSPSSSAISLSTFKGGRGALSAMSIVGLCSSANRARILYAPPSHSYGHYWPQLTRFGHVWLAHQPLTSRSLARSGCPLRSARLFSTSSTYVWTQAVWQSMGHTWPWTSLPLD